MYQHRFDIISFVFGLIFAGIGGAFLIAEVTGFEIGRGWVWPVVAIAVGVAILASAIGTRPRTLDRSPASGGAPERSEGEGVD